MQTIYNADSISNIGNSWLLFNLNLLTICHNIYRMVIFWDPQNTRALLIFISSK